MKKIIIATIIIISAFLAPFPAYASAEQLDIDNMNIYSGMTKSYAQGYTPVISGGKAIIILPLVYLGTEGIEGDTITAKPDLGSTSNSPFVYSNYQLDVHLADNPVGDGSSTVPSYLVRLEIPLASERLNGVYPVQIDTSFSTPTTPGIEQSFTVYVTITDGKDPNATPAPTPEERKREEPKIILTDFSVPETVTAGEPFDIRITLFNTEEYWHAKNVAVTCEGMTSDITPATQVNSYFIDEIKDEETYDMTLHMKTRLDAASGPQKVQINIEYEDSNGTSYSNNAQIPVEIKQPLRLELDDVNIASKVNAGDSLPVSINIYNMGRCTVYNILCSLELQGVIPEGTAYLGNMQPGSGATAEIYSFFGTLDMGGNGSSSGDDNAQKYGMSNGTLTVTYEDEYGEQYSQVVDVSTVIERPVFDLSDEDEEPEEEPERASQWWVSVLLAVGVIMILYGVISYRRKVAKLKKEYGNEDI
mgnify:CR=1 FL=1